MFSVIGTGDRVGEVVGIPVPVMGDTVVACGACHAAAGGGTLLLLVVPLFAAVTVLSIIIFINARTRLIDQ